MIEARDLPQTDPGGELTAPRDSLLLQMRVDRRLGHEWDDWDGLPLPNGGTFVAGPSLFFGAALAVGIAAAFLLAFITWWVHPRLSSLHPALPGIAVGLVGIALSAWVIWLTLLGASFLLNRSLLPAKLAERGLLPRSIRGVERVWSICGFSRDRLGSSALVVFNHLAGIRSAAHSAGDLLILLPRCLSKTSMRAAMDIAGRYGVPAFVASRGRYARQMIADRRPHAVVAIACERDLVSGIGDVAHRLPVLGSTLSMPEGPCRNTEMDPATFEKQLLTLLGSPGAKRITGKRGRS